MIPTPEEARKAAEQESQREAEELRAAVELHIRTAARQGQESTSVCLDKFPIPARRLIRAELNAKGWHVEEYSDRNEEYWTIKPWQGDSWMER